MIGGSNKLRFNLFPDPVGNFGLSGRLGVAGVAGDERVPPAPLGWYLVSLRTIMRPGLEMLTHLKKLNLETLTEFRKIQDQLKLSWDCGT